MDDTVDAYIAQVERAEKAITRPVSKLGGAPIFFEETDTPLCSGCGQPMALLAQLRLDDPLSLAKRYSIAYVFMCLGIGPDGKFTDCETWDPTSGANRVIVQAASDSLHASIENAQVPDHSVTWQRVLEPKVDTSGETIVEPEVWDLISQSTKLGGIPSWVQYEEIPACPACGGATRYVAQLDELYDSTRSFYNFGDAGQGYVFICEKECSPQGAAFLWQCS